MFDTEEMQDFGLRYASCSRSRLEGQIWTVALRVNCRYLGVGVLLKLNREYSRRMLRPHPPARQDKPHPGGRWTEVGFQRAGARLHFSSEILEISGSRSYINSTLTSMSVCAAARGCFSLLLRHSIIQITLLLTAGA
jgi:hypothetical protein